MKKELAPVWFKAYRKKVFGMYMAATALLFVIFYSYPEKVERRNDPHRIENIKSVLQLEDLDFVKMVDELKI